MAAPALDLRGLATQVMTEVKKEVRCSNDCLPRNQLPYVFFDELPAYYASYGDIFLKYMDFSERITASRNVCQLALSALVRTSCPFPITSRHIAVSKFGVGECQELAYLAAVKVHLLGVPHVSLMASCNLAPRISDPERHRGHMFVVIGMDRKSIEGIADAEDSDLLRTLRKMKDCLVLDPFLGIVCTAEELVEHPDFTSYNEPYGIKWVDRFVIDELQDEKDKRSPVEKARKCLEDADRIHGYVISKSLISPEDKVIAESIRLLKLKHSIALIAELTRIFPFTTASDWKTDFKRGLGIWREGDLSTTKQMVDRLKEAGISYKAGKKTGTKDTYALILEYPDVNKLKMLGLVTTEAQSPVASAGGGTGASGGGSGAAGGAGRA